MTGQPKIIFLLSLPRSGSTLLQRMIATHPEVATVSEPWLLLPQIYPIHHPGIYTNYRNVDFQAAINDFFKSLPGGEESYWSEMRDFVRSIYQKISKDKKYFLDKTPRYTLIAPEIARIFPDEKYVFLFRNPLAVISSINLTWGEGKWKIYTYKADLFTGLTLLLDTYLELQTARKALALRYEDLISAPDVAMSQVFSFLELKSGDANTSNFQQVLLSGQLGDPKMNSFSSVSKKPLTSWKDENWNPFRKAWALRYLNWIGAERLALMGYSLDSLKRELAQIPFTAQCLLSDILRYVAGGIYNFMDPAIFRDKWRLRRTPWKISALR